MPTTSSPASHSDALQDFLATPPSWLLHSGMGLMCTIAILAVAMSWFIRYPDRIQATALLRTQQAPVEVVCANGGRLDSILVVDQQWVSCGQALYLLQNTACWGDIQRIEKILNLPIMSSLNASIGSLELGNVQSSFANWDHARESLFQFLNQSLTQQQIAALQQEAEHNKQLDQALAQRREIYLQEVELVQREYDRACSLNTQKIISDQELEAKKMAWLQAHRAVYNLNEETIHNRMRAEQLLTEQLRLRVESQIGLEEVTHHFHQATQSLQVALAEWKQNYLVTAPIDGTLVWQTGLGQGQYLNSNKSLGTVIPGNTQSLIAICTAPVMGSGRMSMGNRVQIELDAFPPDEFGYLEGRVSYISRLPAADQEGKFFYQVAVKLPDTLRSSYGKIIPFRQNLSGSARIVTKERRMLERLIGKLWQLTNFSNDE